MATRCLGRTRALTIGLLALVLVVSGAVPAAAGAPGLAAHGKEDRKDAGAPDDRDTAQEPRNGSERRPRKGGETGSRPARHSTAPEDRDPAQEAGGQQKPAAARPKPSAVHPKPAAHPKPSAHPKPAARPKPSERGRTEPAPAESEPGPAPEPEPRDDAEAPGREAEGSTSVPRSSRTPADVPSPEVRPEAVTNGVGLVGSQGGASAGTTFRPTLATVALAADPSAVTFAAPVPAPVEVAAVERPTRPPRSPLPGPMGHPAFPGLLAALLLGFVAVGCRGDRRDPKLAVAAIDDRDDRAPFR